MLLSNGEGECLTLGLGGWIEDKGFCIALFKKNFQVLCFYCLSSKLLVPSLIRSHSLSTPMHTKHKEVLHPGALAQGFEHQNCQHLSLDLTGKNRRSCSDANNIEFNVYILEKYCWYFFLCNLKLCIVWEIKYLW